VYDRAPSLSGIADLPHIDLVIFLDLTIKPIILQLDRVPLRET
jgi:hypothetical protein